MVGLAAEARPVAPDGGGGGGSPPQTSLPASLPASLSQYIAHLQPPAGQPEAGDGAGAGGSSPPHSSSGGDSFKMSDSPPTSSGGKFVADDWEQEHAADYGARPACPASLFAPRRCSLTPRRAAARARRSPSPPY